MCYTQKEECIGYVNENLPNIIDNLLELEKSQKEDIDAGNVFDFFQTIYLSNKILEKEKDLKDNCPDEYKKYTDELSVLLITELIERREELYRILNEDNKEQETQDNNNSEIIEVGDNIIVTSKRAYFYEYPDYANRTESYIVSNDVTNVTDMNNGFIYTTFTNSEGYSTSGWINLADIRKYE
jgi:hypothetical protein